MGTIIEDYVSFEIAKLLKEKGFDIECDNAYHNGILTDYTLFGFCTDGEFIYAPTLQMAIKWLREVHKLHIEPHIQSYKNYNGNIYNLDGELLLGFTGESPEQVCEAAIKYCLENLI